mmetsp:Transcript_58854/g.68027  ORF Transcript_58854/g.68027 Transcript_58854/m.68027 type:complete len:765 (-) Transcript_58854:37-2331(-)
MRCCSSSSNGLLLGVTKAISGHGALRRARTEIVSRSTCIGGAVEQAVLGTAVCVTSMRHCSLWKAIKSSSPAGLDYQIDKVFDEPFMRLLLEGIDADFKHSIREALTEILPKRDINFTQHSGDVLAPPDTTAQRDMHLVSHQHVIRTLQRIGARGLVSFAEIRSTPRHLLSFYEVLATSHSALSLSAAEHFTFATFVSQHANESIRSQILDGVDAFKVIGTVMTQEHVADEAPFNTEARWDIEEQCFYLRGAAKTWVVNAVSAQWAVVSATITVAKQMNKGANLFFVRLRDDRLNILPGIHIEAVKGEHDPVFEGCGVGTVHFHNVKISKDAMMKMYDISRLGDLSLRSGFRDDVLPLSMLMHQRRLATAALYVGTVKSILTTVTEFTARRYVCGHDGSRRHPAFGVQHVQTPLVANLTKALMHIFGWLTTEPQLLDVENIVKPQPEDEMKLCGLLHGLQESLLDSQNFSMRVLGPHAVLQSTNLRSAASIVALRKEGVDGSKWIREVAYRSVTMRLGTQHWGWRAANALHGVSSPLDRFVKNPFYTPRVADLSRHLLFFSHKHHLTRRRLQLGRDIEERKAGAEGSWYEWTMFRHRQVSHCGEAYMEQFLLDVIIKVTEKAYDPKGRKLLRDLGWMYAVTRIVDNLDFHLSSKMLPLSKGTVAREHQDNLATVLASQAVNLVVCFGIPESWRSPSGAELYWTIPGTTMGVERSDAVAAVDPKQKRPEEEAGETKEEQEAAMNDTHTEHDFLHGLDKKETASKK